MSAAPRPRRCAACGADNQGFATFCHECGEPLDEHARPLPPGGGAPAAARPHARRWEVWLGLALVVGVLGFALADWGQREAQAQFYRAGVAAAQAHHWDAAAEAFARLGSYRDAAKWRDEAAHAILVRDTTYIAGNDAAAFHDWITAYRALSQTVAIEPGYRNAQALFDTATRDAPRQALAGTILRRTDGDHPGLYARLDDGSERRLDGSDASSVVWTTDPGPGRIIYDGPTGPGSAPLPDVAVVATYRRLPPGRHLLLADVRTPDAPPVALPGRVGRDGYVVLAPHGVWSASIGQSVAGDEPRAQPLLGPPLNGLSYDDLQAGTVLTNVLPGPGFYLLDDDPVGQQLLLGRYDPVGTEPPRTRLYRLADGSPRLLTEVPGVVLEAELNPDGTAILYSAETGSSLTHDVRVALVWQDLTQPEPAGRTILARPFLAPPDEPEVPHGRIVPGTQAQVLLRLSADTMTPLMLHDVAVGTDTAVWEPFEQARTARSWPALDGSTLFVDEITAGRPARHTLVVQPLPVPGPARRIPLPPVERGAYTVLLDAALAGPQMIIRTLYMPPSASSDDSRPRAYDERLYSVAATGPVTAPVLLGQQPIATEDIVGGLAPQLARLPAGAVAYPGADGALHLRTLDGAALLPPVPGVNAVWTFHPVPGLLSWNR